MNLIMGVLLLIALAYSIPSTPRQRNISQTEEAKTVRPNSDEATVSAQLPQLASFALIEFANRILNFNSRIDVCFRLCKSNQFTNSPARSALEKTFPNDDDYLLS